MVHLTLRHVLALAVVVAPLMACSSTVGGGSGGGNGGGGGARPDGGSWPDDDEFQPPTDASVCVTFSVEAETAKLPVDIIWAVDTSGSMNYEVSMVNANLNAFAAQISSWDIDYRVIMVAEAYDGYDGVCVPPPLGGPGCTSWAAYQHVPMSVYSYDALQRLVEAYPTYRSFLREESIKHFVVVSDDEAYPFFNDTWFSGMVPRMEAPGFPKRYYAPHGYVFHSIVAWGDVPGIGCESGAAIGQSYLNLTQLTGGVKAKVCETDWNPIFNALKTAVVAGTEIPCSFVIPESQTSEPVNPFQLNVVYTSGGGDSVTIPRVDDPADCGELGWFYNNPSDPTSVIVCDATCDMLTGSSDGRVDLSSAATPSSTDARLWPLPGPMGAAKLVQQRA